MFGAVGHLANVFIIEFSDVLCLRERKPEGQLQRKAGGSGAES